MEAVRSLGRHAGAWLQTRASLFGAAAAPRSAGATHAGETRARTRARPAPDPHLTQPPPPLKESVNERLPSPSGPPPPQWGQRAPSMGPMTFDLVSPQDPGTREPAPLPGGDVRGRVRLLPSATRGRCPRPSLDQCRRKRARVARSCDALRGPAGPCVALRGRSRSGWGGISSVISVTYPDVIRASVTVTGSAEAVSAPLSGQQRRPWCACAGRRGESGGDNGAPWSASPRPCCLWLLVRDARQDSTKMRACGGIIALWGLLLNLKAAAAQGEFRSGCSGIGGWLPSWVHQTPALACARARVRARRHREGPRLLRDPRLFHQL